MRDFHHLNQSGQEKPGIFVRCRLFREVTMDIQKGKWIEEKSGCESPIFKKKFNAEDVESAVIEICGLGWFELYINGKKNNACRGDK